jgi:hypothetical protein
MRNIKKERDIEFCLLNKNRNEIRSSFEYLQREIERIGKCNDKSLFFQNPQIIEKWVVLVNAIQDDEVWVRSHNIILKGKCTYTRLAYLVNQLAFIKNYKALHRAYRWELYSLLKDYNERLAEDGILPEVIDIISAADYCQQLTNTENVSQYFSELFGNSLKARTALYSVLSEIQQILLPIMNQGMESILRLDLTYEELGSAFDEDLRVWTRIFGKRLLREIKEDMNRYYKARRTDPYTPELWGEMLNAEEDALIMASRQELSTCESPKQEHWGEEMKSEMEINGELMYKIYSLCSTDKHFDFLNAERESSFIHLLTPQNLRIFYEIIVRRNLIQCEMYPELKAQHDAWLGGNKESNESTSINDTERPEQENKLNYFAPKKSLQELIKEAWFDRVSLDKQKYSIIWRCSLVEDLMKSDYGKDIATEWAEESKQLKLKFAFIGALIDAGVLKSSYNALASAFSIADVDTATLAKYMGLGKRKKYFEWLKQYVNQG